MLGALRLSLASAVSERREGGAAVGVDPRVELRREARLHVVGLRLRVRLDDPRHSHSGPPIFEKLWRARSPPYRSRFLRPRPHFSAFFENYTIYKPSHRSNLKIC